MIPAPQPQEESEVQTLTIVIEGKNELLGLNGHVQEIYSLCRKYHTKIISNVRSRPAPSPQPDPRVPYIECNHSYSSCPINWDAHNKTIAAQARENALNDVLIKLSKLVSQISPEGSRLVWFPVIEEAIKELRRTEAHP